MEPTLIINVLLSVVLMGMGWWMNTIWQAVKRLQSDMSEMERHATETYVRRDDYRDDMAEIKALIRQILSKLDDKADR
jgi:Tfp pilus assembly protein PilO